MAVENNYLKRAIKSIEDICDSGIHRTHKLVELRILQKYITQKRKEIKNGQ